MAFKSKLVAAFGTSLAILVWVGALSYLKIRQDESDQNWVEHTHLVLEKSAAFQADLSAAGTSQRAYFTTGDQSSLDSYEETVGRLRAESAELQKLTLDNPRQQHYLNELRPLVAARLSEFQDRVELRKHKGAQARSALAAAPGRSFRKNWEQIQALISDLTQEENRLLQRRSAATRTSGRQMKAVIVLGNVLALVFLILAAMLVLREMERRRLAENEIDIRNAALQAANRELEAFCYSVSHDLRAPLRGIDGFSQALLEDYSQNLDETGKQHLERVRAAAQRMSALIDDLLELSRITRAEIQRERIDLSEMARAVAQELSQLDPAREVEFAIAPNLEAEGDPRLMRAALENLLGNGWKFTSRRPRARIEFGRTKASGQSIFFVRDNGAGFDPAYAERLFGAFQRLHASTEFPGTGVGLASVQRIIHRHGGRLWAEGAVNQGATFFFTLSTGSFLGERSKPQRYRSPAEVTMSVAGPL